MGLGSLLGQLGSLAGGGGNLESAFEQAAGAAGQGGIASALSHAFGSDQTPPFGQMIGGLFGQSNPNQQAGILNTILASAGPSLLASGALGGLTSLLGGASSGGQVPQITPEQAQQLTPDQVQQIATAAHAQNPGIIGAASEFYAQHPTLVKGLGASALALMMSHMSQQK